MEVKKTLSSPWVYVPALYFAWGMGEGGILGNLTGIMYKDLGYSNAFVGMLSLLTIPVSFRFLLSPWLDSLGSKRNLIWPLHFLLALVCLCQAAVIRQEAAFSVLSIPLFLIMGVLFGSLAVVTDGYYIRALTPKQQAKFIGIKTAAIRGGIIIGLILLVRKAGEINEAVSLDSDQAGDPVFVGWAVAMLISAGIFVLSGVYNFIFLPRAPSDTAVALSRKGFPLLEVIREYFKQERVLVIVALIIFYRFGQGMVFFMTGPFYMDSVEDGGMGVTTAGVAMLKTYSDLPWMTVGGILGGFIIKVYGLRKTFVPLTLALNLPNLGYVYLAVVQPIGSFTFLGDSFPTWLFVISCFESFGYGLGFSAFLFYLHAIAKGRNKTSMLAISFGIMGIGFSLPGAIAGWLELVFGFPSVFLIATAVGLLSIVFVKIAPMPDLNDPQSASVFGS